MELPSLYFSSLSIWTLITESHSDSMSANSISSGFFSLYPGSSVFCSDLIKARPVVSRSAKLTSHRCIAYFWMVLGKWCIGRSPATISLLVIGIVLLISAGFWEVHTTRSPIIPPRVFKVHRPIFCLCYQPYTHMLSDKNNGYNTRVKLLALIHVLQRYYHLSLVVHHRYWSEHIVQGRSICRCTTRC